MDKHLCLITLLTPILLWGQKLHFKEYTLQDGLAQSQVYALAQDRHGLLWIGTQGGGVNIFDGTSLEVIDKSKGLENLYINALTNHQNQMIVGTDNGIFVYDKVDNNPSKKLAKKAIKALHSNKSNLYIGTESGIYFNYKKLHNGNFNFINSLNDTTYACSDHFVLKIYQGSIIDKFNVKQVRYIYKVKNQILGITYAQGIVDLNNESLIIDAPELNGTLCGTIINDSTYWIGTLRNGIIEMVNGKIAKSIKKENGLASNSIRSIYKDEFSQIWIGTSGKGMQKYLPDGIQALQGDDFSGIHSLFVKDQKTYLAPYEGNIILLEGTKKTILNVQNKKVRCFIPKGDTIFLGTDGAGIYAIIDKEVIQYVADDQIMWTRAMLLEDENWIGTLGNGLIRSGQKIKNQPFSRVNDLIKFQNQLIIASDQGTFSYTNKFKKISTEPARSLATLNGKLYIGSKTEGIYEWDGEALKKLNYSWSDNIYFVRSSADKYLWIGSEKGIQKLEWLKGQPKSTFIGNNVGLLGIETCTNSFCETKNGIWCGTISGAVYIPNTYTQSGNTNNNIILESVKVNGQIKSNLSNLNADQNDIEINTRGINIQQQGQLFYRWDINNTGWRNSKQTISLSALKPGKYKVRAQVSSDKLYWSKPLLISFNIQAPFWLRWWFITLFILVVITVIYISISSYKNQLKSKAEKHQLHAELKDLEMKTLRLQLNPHFLFNCLNSIKGFIADDQPKEARKQITNFSKLMRTYLDYSSQKWITIEDELKMLQQYINLEKMLRANNIDLLFRPEGNLSELKIPTMLLQPFIENSIKHGFSNQDGAIKLKMKTLKKQVICVIEDNGVGYQPKESAHHTSKALLIITERLELLSNIHHDSFKMKILNTGNGTRVELNFPIT